MTISIKNMVCNRCILAVKSIFNSLGKNTADVSMGKVELQQDLTPDEMDKVKHSLELLGFEILDDKRSKIIEKIKNVIIRLVHNPPDEKLVNLSDLIGGELHYEYKYLSTIFSSVEGVTIEKYYIRQKIERAKELLVYDELSLSQIADLLGYSSVAHLSGQFKQVTGFTPTHFKTLREQRKPLDEV
jgi:AraC-like DNA-binding protein